ncbi:hypothetical protein [Sandaracinus amylolyticus]|uniref:hypothetical protein n=1 Tax=Sandaracinus amylolyticus TaxID=927083 RepID=UPI001F1E1382|nr:hypothetical protein [Sandaracinus amylolyticus]UJR83644.1 Hypothetical protein I5071_57130 [Sandaracinus amylolyticus]
MRAVPESSSDHGEATLARWSECVDASARAVEALRIAIDASPAANVDAAMTLFAEALHAMAEAYRLRQYDLGVAIAHAERARKLVHAADELLQAERAKAG